MEYGWPKARFIKYEFNADEATTIDLTTCLHTIKEILNIIWNQLLCQASLDIKSLP